MKEVFFEKAQICIIMWDKVLPAVELEGLVVLEAADAVVLHHLDVRFAFAGRSVVQRLVVELRLVALVLLLAQMEAPQWLPASNMHILPILAAWHTLPRISLVPLQNKPIRRLCPSNLHLYWESALLHPKINEILQFQNHKKVDEPAEDNCTGRLKSP